MRAVVVTEYGGKAEAVELPAPEVQAEQVLIKVLAAGMNPMDRALAGGTWQSIMPAGFPMILGADVAGTVEDVGEDASLFAVGDAVMGQLLMPPLGSTGTYAEFELLERVAEALVSGSIVPPPIMRISPLQAPAVFAGENGSRFDGKTVIVL